jgi:hypothetical protein
MATNLAVDFESGFEDAWANIITFIPKLIAFLVIAIIAYIIAKALQKVVNAILERVGFDTAVERGGIKQALARSKYDASDIVAKLVYYAVLLIGLNMAFGVFGPNPISNYISAIVSYLPLVFVAIVIIVIAAVVAKAVNDLVSNTLGGLSYGKTLANAASGIILFFGIIAALNQLKIAPYVVNGLLYAVLAMVVGVVVVGAGGGLIRPMQQRWEQMLLTAEREGAVARQHVQAARQSSQPYAQDAYGSDPYNQQYGDVQYVDPQYAEPQRPGSQQYDVTEETTVYPERS